MFKNKMTRKRIIFLSALMSIAAVFVMAVTTAAWFQLDSQPLQTSMVSGTGNVSLVNGSTYGYKITPALGADGKINYSNTTVTKKNGSNITTNNNLEGSDTNFDVPDQGIGYYLIEQNAENTFKYKYNSVTMATKFVSKTGGSVNTHYIATKALAAKKYRVKKYTFVANETVYQQVPIETTNSSEITLDATGTNPTYDITVNTAGTYKIWLNYSSATGKWDLSLESTSFSLGGLNRAARRPNQTNRSTSGKVVTGQKFYLKLNGVGDSGNNWTSNNATIWVVIMDAASGATNTSWVQMSKYTGSNQYSIYIGTIPSVSWEIKGVIGVRCSSSGSGWGNKWNQTADLGLTADSQNCIILSGWDSGSLGTYAKTASGTTTTYYFYNFYNGSKVFTGTTMYAYAWDNEKEYGRDNSNLGNAAWPGVTMTLSGTPNLYYIEVSNSYDRIIFNNNSSQTGDLTLNSSKPYWAPSNASGTSGAWNASASYTGTTTYYLYDPGRSLMGTGTHYCYYWDSTGAVETINAWESAASMSYNSTYGYYSITISNYYNSAVFTTNRGNPTNNTQTVNVTLNSSKPYLVLTGTTTESNIIKFTGSWYATIDYSALDNDTTTYYIYDKAGLLNSGAPYAYGYIDNDPSSTTTYHVHYEGTAWPGTLTTNSPLPGGSTNIAGLYSISLSNSFDHIIFNNGSSSVQTDDSSAALVDDCPIFVLDGDSVVEAGITKYTGSWQETLAAVTMTALFFVYDGSSYTKLSTSNITGLTTDLGRGATEDGGTFDPGSVSNQDGKDKINGVLYHFVPEATYWYTSPTTFDNSTKFIPDDTPLDSGANTLYKRMICDLRDMTTIYVDASHSGTGASDTYWQNIAVCGQGGSDTPYFSSNDSGATWKIGTYLYRFTVPSNYTIRVANAGYSSSGGNNTSSNFLVSSLTTSTFIVINAASAGSNCTITQCTDLATSYGTATIYISTNNGSSFDRSYTMSIGDLTSNDYVYELGIQIAAGSYVYVDVLESDGSTHNYYHYDEYIATKPTYIKKETTTGYGNIEMTSYTDNARFNFYVTHHATPANRKLSIAMVPDLGNGYYVLPYSSTLGTTTYSGAIKMSMGSNVSASYDGYYATANSQIFIRSYLDAVDSLYKSGYTTGVNQTGVSSGCVNLCGVVAEHTDVQLNTTTGVITFGSSATGFYDIDVYNGVIAISKYSIGDFFKLNALNTSSVTRAGIKNQITTLVIEVKFTCNNSYASKMTLTAENDMSDFVGAALYCTTSGGKLNDPYNYLRTNHYNAISATTSLIQDSNTSFVVPANSASEYYAYIMIDYLPTEAGGDFENFLSDCGGNIFFYLNAVQYIPS